MKRKYEQKNSTERQLRFRYFPDGSTM